MILITLALICICATYLLWKQYYTRSDEPPVLPGSWPFVGHLLSFVGDGAKFWDRLSYLSEQCTAVGGVASVRVGPKTMYVVTDPDDILTVANTCLEKEDFYDFAKPWLGEGLFIANQLTWKTHRKMLSPAFNQAVLDRFICIFNSQSRKLVNDLNKETVKGSFDCREYTKTNALESICMTVLGIDFTDSLLTKEYLKTTDLLKRSFVERFLKFWWISSYTFRFSALKKTQDGFIKILQKTSDTVLQKRKIEFDSNNYAQHNIFSGTRLKTFMDLLLELSFERNVLSDEDIRAHLDTIIAAGEDTLSVALSHTMVLLGAHPKVQEKIFNEIKQILGDEDRDVTKHDLPQLVYLEAVIKESLRIRTVAPIVGRKLDRDVKLKNCSLLAGRSCCLFLFGAHLHPMWGPDRNEFSPERWLDPSRLPENPNAFAAFSMGKRNCIGKTYAMMLMKTTLAHLVRRYRITAKDSPTKLKFEVLLLQDKGHFINIEKRT